MSFLDLKKNKKANFEKTLKEAENVSKPAFSNEKDPNEWYPGVDKVGNALHIIRFLPAVSDDDLPFVKLFRHEFQDDFTKKWYIENCRSTICGDYADDPVMVFNSKIFSAYPGDENKKHPMRQQASNQGRKTSYKSNIYIIKDGVNPENNGTVKKFNYGKWAWDKIDGALFPKFEGKERLDPFDLFDGVNFVIEITSEKKDGKLQRSYSGSHFESNVGPLFKVEKKMEEVYNSISEWSLKSYLDPKNFKSFDDLKKRLDLVVGYDTSEWTKDSKASSSYGPADFAKDTAKSVSTSKPEPKLKEVKEPEVVVDEDDGEDFFASLNNNSKPF